MNLNSKEVIKKITEIFKIYFNNQYDELIDMRMNEIESIFFYYPQKRNEKIEEAELPVFLKYYGIDNFPYNKKYSIYRSIFIFENAGMCPYIDNNSLKKIIYIPIYENKKEITEHYLFHELLHALYEHIIYVDNEKVISQSGFEQTDYMDYKNSKRKYERINEAIHDLIAIDIMRFAHENNIYLYSNQNNNYKPIKQLKPINVLYQSYKIEFAEYFLTGNITELLKIIGEECFEELVEWLNIFYEEYPKEKSEDYASLIFCGMIIIKKIIDKKTNKTIDNV